MKPSTDQPATPKLDEERAGRISEAVYQFLSSRNGGENLAVSSYCERFPDLAPELHDAIESGLRQLRQVMDAERVGPIIPPAQDQDSSAAAISSEMPRWVRVKGYRVVRMVSAGSQGTVYEAIQESTGKTVAMKVVLGFTMNSVTRFEREASLLAGLTHPGIASIIDRGRTADDAYFLVLEFIRGCDLDEWLGKLSPDGGQQRIVKMFALIARAIDAAHRQGIVHRDLKPSNILVDEHEQPRIVDFGLAQLVGDSREFASRKVTVTGNIVGSIPWSSPEQAGGQAQNISPASDVYSLGVLLYHALTQSFPYNVDGPLFLVTENICKKPARHPSEFRTLKFGRIDKSLTYILLKCLAKAQHDRFASGGDLAAALDAYGDGSFRIPKKARPWRRVIGAIGAIVVIAIIIVVSAVVRTKLHHDPIETSQFVPNLETYVNAEGMRFVKVPAGGFRMGSAVDEAGHEDSEQSHLVTISRSFFIAQTETTRGQYLQVMGSLPEASMNADLDLPVDHVSWNDANDFCRKLSQLDHHDYQLPTDAEWEYACRGGVAAPVIGDELRDAGWFAGNSEGRIHPVATKRPNRWGIFDMRGNVAEWARDNFVASLGHEEALDPIQTNKNGTFVLRGGSAFDGDAACRPAARRPLYESDRKVGIGFRITFH